MADTTAADVLSALRETDEPIVVRLRGGLEMAFRRPAGADEYLKIGTRARKFSAAVQQAGAGPFAAWAHLSTEAITAAYWLHSLGIAPEWSQQDALDLADTCGPAALLVYSRIMTECSGAVVADETEAMDSLGEDSGPILSDATT